MLEDILPADLGNTDEATHMDVALQTEEVIQAAKNDPNFLSGIAMPEIFEYNFPPAYMAIWSILTGYASSLDRLFKHFALGLPRGFGKTTFIKLLALWIILFTKRKFILILSENREKACNIISDIVDMLEEPNIRSVFGDWKVGAEQDTQALKKFNFRGRDIIIAGLGVGGSVRGLNLKNVRPDVILLDDVQSRESADSEVISKGIYNWMQGTVMKARSPKGCLTIFIANMYPTPHSILKKLQKNKFWEKIIAGGILQKPDGTIESLWEELQPLKQLLEMYEFDLESGTPEIFHSEVLNDPDAKTNTAIDLDKIPDLPFDDNEQELHQGSFIVIDPATDKTNSDMVSIGYFQVHDRACVLWDLIDERLSPLATVTRTLELASRYNCRAIIVEGVAYQSTLRFWFQHFIMQLGIEGISVLEIYPGRSSKNSRILTMFKQLTGGSDDSTPEILLHPRVRTAVFNQIRSFNHLKTNNVDNILDLLTYAPRVLNEFEDYISTLTIEADISTSQALLDYQDLEDSELSPI